MMNMYGVSDKAHGCLLCDRALLMYCIPAHMLVSIDHDTDVEDA